jgi:predicted phage tail protein
MSPAWVVVVILLAGALITGMHLIRTAFRRHQKDGLTGAATDMPVAQTVVDGERRSLEPVFGESMITVSAWRITLGIFLLVGGVGGLLFMYGIARMARHAGH